MNLMSDSFEKPMAESVETKAHSGSQCSERVWDVICIGSGTGSLAAATALARLGRSVLVLESHSQFGGLTHTFARRGQRWATGFHYTGWPTAYANDFPELWSTLTRDRAPWQKLPEDNDVYLRPDARFTKRATREQYRADLHTAFPREKQTVDCYLADMREYLRQYRRFMTLQAVPRALEQLGVGWYQGRRFLQLDRLSVQKYMDSIKASRHLRETLWFNWGNFDGHPERTSIGAYCVPMEYMMDGLWTPRNGADSAARAFVGSLLEDGGEVRRSSRVTSLLYSNGQVSGVRVGDEILRGRKIISGIGARETYNLLIAEQRPAVSGRILQLPSTASIMTVYLSLNREALQTLQLNAVNYWVECERDGMYRYWDDFSHLPPWFVLSLASAYQSPVAASEGDIPGELFVGMSHSCFDRWRGSRTQKRGADYAELKSQLLEQTLTQLEKTWPGFRRAVMYAEVSTPLTIESYTGHLHGAAYGIAPVLGRYNERGLRCHSGVGNLFLAGQDVAAAGIIGAFYGGLAAASAVLRRDVSHRLLDRQRFSTLEWMTGGVLT